MDFATALRFYESANQLLCILAGKGEHMTPAEEMLFHHHSSLANTIAMVIEGYLHQNVIHQEQSNE